ncbi:hypothetical protein ES703_91795 [subsurface metagenome]
MVLLPLPVGPVTIIMPWGCDNIVLNSSRSSGSKPSCSTSWLAADASRIRITTFSPYIVGITDTRTSISLPEVFILNRPSWGSLRSAMSISERILILVTTAACIFLAGGTISRSTPSIRMRIIIECSCGSI